MLFCCTVLALGMFITSICSTVKQLSAAGNLGAVLVAGFGGAIAPLSSLPEWMSCVAPFTPNYWAMRGFNTISWKGPPWAR
jgi:ABC-2 type transport system permease protein